MNKYEKLIEYIISEQEDLARELFHEIVVEKSRSIYESLMDETADPDSQTGTEGKSPVDDLVDEISAEETMALEDAGEMGMDDEEMMPADDDMDMGDEEMDMGDEEMDTGDEEMDMGDEEMSMDDESEMDDSVELEDRVDDLESALDELKAEFDKIMAGEEEGEEGEEDDGLVREYVEKVGHPSNKAEGHEVGKGGSVAVNKSSVVAGKNDMGGTSANIAKGGAEANPDGTSAKKPSNYGTKGQGQLKGAGSYENVPGANTKGYKNRASAKKGEESGVNRNSIEQGS